MPYIPYTDEQKQLANSVDLPEFLRMRDETLERAGREYKLQSKTSSQAYQLDKFKSDTNSVILGTGTYWEGINVEGESLSQVIVYKLPFPVPEPIIDYKMSLTDNPIDEVAVPEMVIQLKQGVGRLIRSASDTGIVTILDPRVSLRKAKYANVALDALSVKNRADSIEELQTFWDKITNEGSQR